MFRNVFFEFIRLFFFALVFSPFGFTMASPGAAIFFFAEHSFSFVSF